MAYGLQITGSDSGGTFKVSDTEIDMVNLRVTDAGRAHSFTLPGGLQESDLIFVKNPSAPGGSSFTSINVSVPDDYNDRYVTFYEPSSFYIVTNTDNDKIWFFGNDVLSYMPMLDGEFGSFDLARYDGWAVEMDYFVVRKSSIIMDDPSRYRDDIDHGLRVVTSNGEVSFDSRALVSNQTFDIVSYLPPLLSNLIGTDPNRYVLSKEEDEYVNIEWTKTNTNNSFFYGLGMLTSTMAFVWDADIGYTGQGDERLVTYPTGGLIGAKLNLDGGGTYTPIDDGDLEPVDSDTNGNEITGSLEYQSGSAFTEGSSISFNASTSMEGSYHVRLFQTSGSNISNDFETDRISFYDDSKTVTFNTSSPILSRSVQYARSNNFVGTYSRTRISSYTRGRSSSFTRDFSGTFTGDYTGNFLGTYERVRTLGNSYLGEYTGNYSGEYSRTRSVDYTRTRNSSYATTFSDTYARTRTSVYTGYYSRSTNSDYTTTSVGYYMGNFTRNSVGYGITYYTRLIETEPGEFEEIPFVSQPSTTNFTRTRYSSFSRTRIASRSSAYSRTFIGNYVGNFEGNYSRTRNTNYTGEYNRTRLTNFEGNFAGNYGRTIYYTGEYSRSFSADPSARIFEYSRDFAGNFTNTFTRTLDYTGDFVGNYVNAAVDYTRNRTAIRYSSYTRTRTKSSSYARSFFGNYIPNASTRVLTFIGNYSRGFARNYLRIVTFEGAYTGNFEGNFAAGGFTRSYTGNFLGNYTRTSSAYTYTASTTFWSERDVYDFDSGGMTKEINVKYGGVAKIIAFRDFFGGTSVMTGNDGQSYWKGTLATTVSGTSYYEVGQSPNSYTTPTGSATDYTRTSSRTRSSTFSTGATYTRDYTNIFAGNYSNVESYSRSFVRGYTSAFTRTSTYASTRITVEQGVSILLPHNGYSRVRPSSYSRTIYYGGNYVRGFVGDFVGNYTRGVDYVENYTRGSSRVFYYSRNFIGIRQSSYSRTVSYNAPTRDSAYSRTSTKSSSYTRNRTSNFEGNFAGNYSRVSVGNFEGNYNRTRVTSEYTRNSVVNYNRSFSPDYVGNYSRDFVGDYVGNFAGNFIGNFVRQFIGDYIGNFTRIINSNSTGYYSRSFEGNYTGDYSGNFTRQFAGNYSRNSIGGYTGAYEGTYTRTSTTNTGFTGNYERTRVTESTRTGTRTRVSSYTNTFGASYERGFVGDFVGNYIGNYSRTSTATQQTSEIGWQGETFIAELRRGGDNVSMAEPRGSSNVQLLDSKSFTLYDNDIGTIFTTTQNLIHNTATTHTVTFDLSIEGDQLVSGRVYNADMILLTEFTVQNSNGTHSVIVSDVPAEGQSKQYTIALYNGDAWLNSGEYTVTKISGSATSSTPSTGYTSNFTTTPPNTSFTGNNNNPPNIEQ